MTTGGPDFNAPLSQGTRSRIYDRVAVASYPTRRVSLELAPLTVLRANWDDISEYRGDKESECVRNAGARCAARPAGSLGKFYVRRWLADNNLSANERHRTET